jgi:two-component system, response regulator
VQVRRESILLVEDSDDDSELLIRAFLEAGVDSPIVRIRDGQEALDYLAPSSGKDLPAAVLLDLGLPRVGGLAVLSALRDDERTRQLSVVVMTSSARDEDRLAAYERGATSYVRKPVDYSTFVNAIKTLSVHWSASLTVSGAP